MKVSNTSDAAKKDFLDFLEKCAVPYLFNAEMRERLTTEGYIELFENDHWTEIPKKGFIIRGNRALVAFNIGGYDSALIVGTHSDSPCLKIRNKPDFTNRNMKQVRVYTYGGTLSYTWMGRDLRLVGCVIIRENSKLVEKLFDSEDAIAFIPALDLGASPKPNIETDLVPIIGGKNAPSLLTYVAKRLEVNEEDVVDWDLSFVDANPPKFTRNLISSQRIDNLGSTYSALKAFVSSNPRNTVNVLAVFDNEEVGSESRFGALGDLLPFVLKRIVGGPEKYIPFIAKSLFVSSDNSHALHPNYSSKHDKEHQPLLGKGIVIKKSPNASYATDISTAFQLKHAADAAKVPIQYFMNRNDIGSGSTIGPLVSTLLGIPTVDIGQPQLSMHSIRETMAFGDVEYLTALLIELYNNYEDHQLKC